MRKNSCYTKFDWLDIFPVLPFTGNVERQLERQGMDALNCFPSVITYRWSYKVS